MPEEIKMLFLHKRNEIMDKVKNYINNFLNSSKIHFYDPSRDDFIEVKSVSEVLQELKIPQQEYGNLLKISVYNPSLPHL